MKFSKKHRFTNFTNSYYQDSVGGWDTGDVFIGNYTLDLDRNEPFGSLFGEGNFNIVENYTDVEMPRQSHALESTPWLYVDGGDLLPEVGHYKISSVIDDDNFFNEQEDSTNDTRWVLQLYNSQELINIVNSGALIHLTLECGNDTIHASVPEPATMMLLGLVAIGRKKYLK